MNKDIYKNPLFYYIVVPLILTLWPLMVWAVYLPKADTGWTNEKKQYEEAQKAMVDILQIDPDRLDFANAKTNAPEFDYATVFNKVATSCGIPDSGYRSTSSPARVTKGQKTQNAQLVLNQIDIAKFTKFISTLQLRWASLQCTSVKLTKVKGLPDAWKIDLEFRYYF
jgi:hypothetical protein